MYRNKSEVYIAARPKTIGREIYTEILTPYTSWGSKYTGWQTFHTGLVFQEAFPEPVIYRNPAMLYKRLSHQAGHAEAAADRAFHGAVAVL